MSEAVTCTDFSIALTSLILGAIIAVGWGLYDSLLLRFVILFLGTINALYAIWDVHLDGVKYGKVAVSDCTQMAHRFNEKVSTSGRGKTSLMIVRELAYSGL